MSVVTPSATPHLTFSNRQRIVRFNRATIASLTNAALRGALSAPGPGKRVLAELASVDFVVLSDAAMAKVHGEFFADETPTDVITFEHGEILLGAGVALRNAKTYGVTIEEELALYCIHGLLHLNGHVDDTPAAAARMKRIQDRLLAEARTGA